MLGPRGVSTPQIVQGAKRDPGEAAGCRPPPPAADGSEAAVWGPGYVK